MSYTPGTFSALEQPTVTKWNYLWGNDAEFNDRFRGLFGHYQITRSVASNDLTVALKNIGGTDPSSTAPVVVEIGGTVRVIESALSFTLSDGTNYFGAGATETAGKEIDLFIYLGYRGSTSSVFLGAARIAVPVGTYADFSGTNTDPRYLAYSGAAPASGDKLVLIGRTNATLGASATYLWSSPATEYTVNFPVIASRLLTFDADPVGFSTVAINSARYRVIGRNFHVDVIEVSGTSNSSNFKLGLPVQALNPGGTKSMTVYGVNNGALGVACMAEFTTNDTEITMYLNSVSGTNVSVTATWANSGTKGARISDFSYGI